MIETCSYRQEWVTVSCIQYTQGKNLVMKIPNWDFGLWHNELVVNFPEAVRRYLYNLISISCSAPLTTKVGTWRPQVVSGEMKSSLQLWRNKSGHASRCSVTTSIISGDIGGRRRCLSLHPVTTEGTGAGECVYLAPALVTSVQAAWPWHWYNFPLPPATGPGCCPLQWEHWLTGSRFCSSYAARNHRWLTQDQRHVEKLRSLTRHYR